jgi:hypothetical protein
VLAFALLATALASAPSQAGGRLSLYIYSRDSAAGFADELLDVFRRDLGKHAESFTELAYDAESADVRVELLGQGELTVEIGPEEKVSFLFRPDDKAPRMWAIVRVSDSSKEFGLEGSGGRDMSRLAKAIADFLQQNAGAILERSNREQ